jgi:hypothetical protein
VFLAGYWIRLLLIAEDEGSKKFYLLTRRRIPDDIILLFTLRNYGLPPPVCFVVILRTARIPEDVVKLRGFSPQATEPPQPVGEVSANFS